jgi:hypothetical protein
MPQQADEARRGRRDAAVGPAHSRGVVGLIPDGGPLIRDPLEGAGSQSLSNEKVKAILRDG